jgi:hypothetical protein
MCSIDEAVELLPMPADLQVKGCSELARNARLRTQVFLSLAGPMSQEANPAAHVLPDHARMITTLAYRGMRLGLPAGR